MRSINPDKPHNEEHRDVDFGSAELESLCVEIFGEAHLDALLALLITPQPLSE